MHSRSEITIKDEATKFGTEIDGVRIKDETKVLQNVEHSFRLGKSEQIFRYAQKRDLLRNC